MEILLSNKDSRPLCSSDTIDEMHPVYNRYKGHTPLSVDASGWHLVR